MKCAACSLLKSILGTVLLLQTVTYASAKQPTPVIIQKVVTAQFSDRVEALGTLRANESVEITATVSDTITAIHFTDGQRVSSGDILIELTSREEHALLEEELSTAAEAEKQYNRLKTLVERGAAATSLLDVQQREFDTARARLQAINSRLGDRLIVAPFSGVLGLRNISVGALIEPGDVITTLDDDSIMKLDFTISSVHLASLNPGIAIQATCQAFPGKIFTGKISSINSRIDTVTRAISVRAVIPNPERLLKPGLLMQVTLLKNSRIGMIVPEEALIPLGRNNFVLVVEPRTNSPIAEQRRVELGIRRKGEVEVVGGLRQGEYVITHGTIKVRNGQEVSIVAEEQGNEMLEQLLSGNNEGKAQ